MPTSPDNETVTADLPQNIIEAMDAWSDAHTDPKPSRSEVVAYAMRDWLTGLGLLPFHDDPEDAN